MSMCWTNQVKDAYEISRIIESSVCEEEGHRAGGHTPQSQSKGQLGADHEKGFGA